MSNQLNGTTNGNATNGKSGSYKYRQQYLGQSRPVRIIFIGAGVSGIGAVHLFKETFANSPVELAIYEKNADVGGTWLENRYPGCACDVPAHAYGYSWEGNPHWSKAYVSSEALFDYFKGRSIAYGVDEFLHLNHKVESARWLQEKGKWSVEIRNLKTGETLVDEAEVLINGAGFLNSWKWPDIPGISNFEGKLMHSARWDDGYEFENRSIAVIGSGSSAIQIVPKLQPKVKHLTSFNRSPTWITPEFAAEFAPEGRESHFSEEQKQKWATNPNDYLKYRKKVESSMNKFFDLQYTDSELQKQSFMDYTATMKKRLAVKPDLIEKLVPSFAVGCRRITPGHGYLEALASDNVDVLTGAILEIQKKGIKMKDGSFVEVDCIVCATGFDTSFRPPFPLIGPEGKDLRDVWTEEPRSYLSFSASGFPNYFITSGPNFPLANGCLIPCLEACIKYALAAVKKIQREDIKCLSPKAQAVDDFQEHKDSLMKDLVWSSPCRSWYKNGNIDGKVWGPWPGSALQFLELMEHPRWEDWDIEYRTSNRFAFMGSGKTYREESDGDLTHYLSHSIIA